VAKYTYLTTTSASVLSNPQYIPTYVVYMLNSDEVTSRVQRKRETVHCDKWWKEMGSPLQCYKVSYKDDR